jgi:hypothetical protein
MGKMHIIDGKPHRERRGKMVEIPEEWVGKTLTQQTRRKRRSHQSRYQRDNEASHALKDGTYDWKRYREKRFEMADEEA